MIETDIIEIQPFDFQAECLDAIEIAENSGANRALVIMAGGLGKTIVSALYFKKRRTKNPTARGLFLCHQNDILEQAQIEYSRVFGDSIEYGFFNGYEKTDTDSTMIFASFQTLRENLGVFRDDEFDYIVVDESHHSKAETFEPVILYFNPAFLLGITMISDRMDGLDIREIYGNEVFNLSLMEALARGYLCPIDYRLMTDEIGSLKTLSTAKGRLSIKKLNKLVFIPRRDGEIVSIIKKEMELLVEPRVMIFVQSVEHAELLAEMIPNAVPIHSKVSKNERCLRLQLFRQGVFKAMICIDAFNEGIDIKEANLIVFLRQTGLTTVFFEQLCRGLRLHSSKDKVVVLDFVANCERILAVYELWTKVKIERERVTRDQQPLMTPIEIISTVKKTNTCDQSTGGSKEKHFKKKTSSGELEPFNLNVDTVQFQEKIIPLIERINKIRESFYLTWQEASEAAKKLNISTVVDYIEKYKQDQKLPSLPSKYYDAFPGWYKFLGKDKKNFYSTWEEASVAAIALGIISMRDYHNNGKYKKDSKLPVLPQVYYPNFPGWHTFLGKDMGEFYRTWQEASEVVVKLQVISSEDYAIRFSLLKEVDKKLHFRPSAYYEDFPGWDVFLDRKGREFYSTWELAAEAVRKLSILSFVEYRKRYKEDIKLPMWPSTFYKDFPGWDMFFSK